MPLHGLFMMNLKPKWVFFDIDDTLWDFATNSLKSLTILYSSEKILQQTFSDCESFIHNYHIINTSLWNDFNKGKINSDFLKIERFRQLLWHDDTLDNASVEQINISKHLCSEYLRILGTQTTLVNGAVETLSALQPHYCIAALTNGFREVQYKKIYNTGLWRYIQRMVISDETSWHKPQIELFDYARNAVGAHPEECLMIGDNPDTDIAGALNAGWNAVYFNKNGKGDIIALPQLLPLLGVQ